MTSTIAKVVRKTYFCTQKINVLCLKEKYLRS